MNNEKQRIFLVDDNASNLMVGRNLLAEIYNVYTCNSGQRMFNLLEKVTPSLILLDIEMPDMDGYEVLQRLKENRNTADIPVLFLTAHDTEETKNKGRLLGVSDFITKPFFPPLLLKCIETHLGGAIDINEKIPI